MSERLLNCVFDGDMSVLPALLYQENTSNLSLRGVNWLKRCFNCVDNTPVYFYRCFGAPGIFRIKRREASVVIQSILLIKELPFILFLFL